MEKVNNIAICCMSGGYKNAFTQGVLTAFEESGYNYGYEKGLSYIKGVV